MNVFQGLYVEELKRELQAKINQSAQCIRLEYQGQILFNQKRVNDYNIQKDDVISMAIFKPTASAQQQFGIKLGTYNDGELYSFSAEEPSFRFCASGLNVEGKCVNEQCKHNDRMVICPLGEGQFNTVSAKPGALCPACHEPVQIANYFLANCHYAWSALVENLSGVQEKKTALTISHLDNQFRQLTPQKVVCASCSDDSDLQIIRFTIYTKVEEIDDSASERMQLTNTHDSELYCCICKSSLNKELSNSFECGHNYHKICGHMVPPPLQNICPICLF